MTIIVSGEKLKLRLICLINKHNGNMLARKLTDYRKPCKACGQTLRCADCILLLKNTCTRRLSSMTA